MIPSWLAILADPILYFRWVADLSRSCDEKGVLSKNVFALPSVWSKDMGGARPLPPSPLWAPPLNLLLGRTWLNCDTLLRKQKNFGEWQVESRGFLGVAESTVSSLLCCCVVLSLFNLLFFFISWLYNPQHQERSPTNCTLFLLSRDWFSQGSSQELNSFLRANYVTILLLNSTCQSTILGFPRMPFAEK